MFVNAFSYGCLFSKFTFLIFIDAFLAHSMSVQCLMLKFGKKNISEISLGLKKF